MSYFVVQVRTGSEIEVKEMMEAFLSQSKEHGVQSIYAMETYTQTVNDKTDQINLHELTSIDISNHLFTQRLQANLSNLRVAYEHLQNHHDYNSLHLLTEYRKQIKEVTSELKNIRNTTRKISSVLPGYILIELSNNFHYLPSHLYHTIKSIPKVMGFPSKMNIPRDEVDAFFEEADMSPKIEMQFDEILNYEQSEKKKESLLQQANQSSGTKEEEWLEEVDNMNIDFEQEINDMKQTPSSMIKRIKTFIKNKRKTISIPVSLFQEMYKEVKIKGVLPAKLNSPSDCIYRLWRWLQEHEVVLE